MNNKLKRKLTKKQKEAIREWLKNKNKKEYCPFEEIVPKFCDLDNFTYPLCLNSFQRMKKQRGCPCNQYSLSYVIRKAKEMVK